MKVLTDLERDNKSAPGSLDFCKEGHEQYLNESSSFLIKKFKQFDPNLAVAELDLSLEIINADENYHYLLGYDKDELINESHSLLLESEYLGSDSYAQFEKEMLAGLFLKGKFNRVNKKGEEITLEGVYFPVVDEWQRIKKIVNIYFNENSRSSTLPGKTDQQSFENTPHLKSNLDYRLLIIEDEKSLKAPLVTFLNKEGYKNIMMCESGREALKVSGEFNPEIIILNYHLKKENAIDISSKIQTKFYCPVIFIGSFKQDIQAINKNLKNSFFLDEPVDRKQLISLLRHIQLL